MAETSNGAAPEGSNDQDNQSCNKTIARDLRQVECEKNPGHADFIPTGDFSIDRLPHLYRDEDVFLLVKATSDLTFFLKNSGKNGTGWVSHVEKYTVEDDMECQCEDCLRSGTCTSRKEWAEIYMKTAGHLVENDVQAKNTKCHFFFDSNELSIKELSTLTGLRVVKMEGDSCEMMCATHDMKLVNQLQGMYRRWNALNKKVQSGITGGQCGMGGNEVGRDGTRDAGNICVIVSHPHGHSKHVTVGTWEKRYPKKDHDRYVENCVYTYSTPTCEGSSGAPVIALPRDGVRILCWSNYPVHSGARRDVPGVSGGHKEATLIPREECDFLVSHGEDAAHFAQNV